MMPNTAGRPQLAGQDHPTQPRKGWPTSEEPR